MPVPAPSPADLQGLVQRIAERIGRSLERSGLITRDIENAYLAFDPGEEAPINGLLGASITYRIATGPREGQKVFTLQTLPAESDGSRREVVESSGFSLHAGLAAKASQRDKLDLEGWRGRGLRARRPQSVRGIPSWRREQRQGEACACRDGAYLVGIEPGLLGVNTG